VTWDRITYKGKHTIFFALQIAWCDTRHRNTGSW